MWLTFGVGVVLLVLTKSRTATAAFWAAIVAVQLVRLPASDKIDGLSGDGVVGALALWMVWVCGIDPTTDFRDAVLLGRADEAETLSGRVFIWPEVIRYAQERLLGYGYGSFWTPGRIEAVSKELGWGLPRRKRIFGDVAVAGGGGARPLARGGGDGGHDGGGPRISRTNDATYTLPVGLILFGLINAGSESGMVVVTLVPFMRAVA